MLWGKTYKSGELIQRGSYSTAIRKNYFKNNRDTHTIFIADTTTSHSRQRKTAILYK